MLRPDQRIHRLVAVVLAPACLCGALSGCGRSSGGGTSAHPVVSAHSICLGSARDAIARALKVSPKRITAARSIGNDAAPQCRFDVSGAPHVSVLVNVQHIQGAYFVLERTIVEAAQVFAPAKPGPPPVSVIGLGLDASWFPQEQWLQTTDGTRLVIVTVDWTAARQHEKITLARTVAQRYLHTPHGKLAQRLAEGFPSSGG